MELWKLAGKGLWKRLVDLMKKIWRKDVIPKDWRSIVVPLHKRENFLGNSLGDISLLYTTYKIYADIIRKRMEREIEAKDMAPESQVEFRKGTIISII